MPGSATSRSAEGRLLAALAVLVAVASVYAIRQADPDLWGHLRYGRHFVENGPTETDPFAYTSSGRTWYHFEHLAQMTLWLAHDAGGPLGLILLKCLVGGGTIYCLYAGLRLTTDDPRVWAPLLMLTAGIVGRSFVFRPQLFTFLFSAIFVLVLFRRLLGKPSPLWMLPLVMGFWANMHGGFLAGLGAVGLAIILASLQSYQKAGLSFNTLWKDTRALWLVLIACLIASLANPQGWRLWVYILTELSHDVNRRLIDEWMPVRLGGHLWSTLALLLLLAILFYIGLAAQWQRARIALLPPWLWLLSCVPLAVMAFQSIRHIPVLAIWCTPIVGLLGQQGWQAWGDRRLWQRGWLAVTGLTALPSVLMLLVVGADPRPRIAVTGAFGRAAPFSAAAFLRDNGLEGNVYAPLWWGSYLTWELYPDVLVAMDGRNVSLFSSRMVEENLLFYKQPGQADLDAPLHYATDYLIIPTDSEALTSVRQDHRWLAIFEDGDAVVFVRADAQHADVIRRWNQGELRLPQGPFPALLE